MDTSFARAARSLAQDYPPTWNIPPDMQWFALPDREIASYVRACDLATLCILRGIMSEHLEAIEDGTYYAHRGTGVDGQRSRLDRAEAYHRLWWCDVFLAVHTRC